MFVGMVGFPAISPNGSRLCVSAVIEKLMLKVKTKVKWKNKC